MNFNISLGNELVEIVFWRIFFKDSHLEHSYTLLNKNVETL